MGTTCAAYGCTNRGKKGSTVRFHKFPSIKRADLRKKQTLAMKRKNFNPSASTTVCSDHFRSEDYEVGVLLPILTLALNFFCFPITARAGSAFSNKAERTHSLHCQSPTAPFFSFNFFEQGLLTSDVLGLQILFYISSPKI